MYNTIQWNTQTSFCIDWSVSLSLLLTVNNTHSVLILEAHKKFSQRPRNLNPLDPIYYWPKHALFSRCMFLGSKRAECMQLKILMCVAAYAYSAACAARVSLWQNRLMHGALNVGKNSNKACVREPSNAEPSKALFRLPQNSKFFHSLHHINFLTHVWSIKCR